MFSHPKRSHQIWNSRPHDHWNLANKWLISLNLCNRWPVVWSISIFLNPPPPTWVTIINGKILTSGKNFESQLKVSGPRSSSWALLRDQQQPRHMDMFSHQPLGRLRVARKADGWSSGGLIGWWSGRAHLISKQRIQGNGNLLRDTSCCTKTALPPTLSLSHTHIYVHVQYTV